MFFYRSSASLKLWKLRLYLKVGHTEHIAPNFQYLGIVNIEVLEIVEIRKVIVARALIYSLRLL
jgi:hypothetical protein